MFTPSAPGASPLESVHLVPYGSSALSDYGYFTGLLDFSLTDQNVHEIERIADGITVEPDALVLCSTSRRSRQAGLIVADRCGVESPPQPHWELNERNLGAVTGLPRSAVRSSAPWLSDHAVAPPPMTDSMFRSFRESSRFADLPDTALSRSESIADVSARLSRFVEDTLTPLLALRPVVVIGHRTVTAVLSSLTSNP